MLVVADVAVPEVTEPGLSIVWTYEPPCIVKMLTVGLETVADAYPPRREMMDSPPVVLGCCVGMETVL